MGEVWEVAAFALGGERVGEVRIGAQIAAWEIRGGEEGATVVTVGGDVYRFELFGSDPGHARQGVRAAVAVAFVQEWGAIIIVDQSAIHVCEE
jgi:hypothetical protein